MAATVRDVMTSHPTALVHSASVFDAARSMRDRDIGDVVVLDEHRAVLGVLTDRDIVVRVVAEGRDPQGVPIGEVCSRELATVTPHEPLSSAADLMRERAVRRLPVVDSGELVGVLSIGDIAVEHDSSSVLADISAARGNV